MAQPSPQEPSPLDALHQEAVERLHQLSVYSRWLCVLGGWLTIGLLSLWQLRSEVALWLDDFTWAALRYGLAYNRTPALGLAFCIGLTVSVLVWQTRNHLFGYPHHERLRLEQQVLQIRKQGPSHPLWKWVYRKQ